MIYAGNGSQIIFCLWTNFLQATHCKSIQGTWNQERFVQLAKRRILDEKEFDFNIRKEFGPITNKILLFPLLPISPCPIFFNENAHGIFGFYNPNWVFPLFWVQKMSFHQFRFYNSKTPKKYGVFLGFFGL